MRIRNKNMFLWTLRGKPYLYLCLGSLALLAAAMGVLA